MVRTVDIVPTLLDLVDINSELEFDGVSLLPFIKSGEAKGLINYAEELYDKRGPGDFQAIRDDRYKLIIDHRNNRKEEFYDLRSDPNEQKNLISDLTGEQKEVVDEWRTLCKGYEIRKHSDFSMEDQVKTKVEERLRMLGYIE